MNQHAESPHDANADPTEPDQQPGGLFALSTEVTWAILGTGFLLGILIGAVFIVGRTSATSAHTMEMSPAAPAVASMTVVSPRPATDDAADLAAQRQQLQREVDAETLRLEVAALRQELADLQSRQAAVEGREPRSRTALESNVPPTQPVAATSSGLATLTYWNQLNAIILQEAALRSSPSGGVTASNAGAFLDARMQAGEFAVTSLRQLKADSVDSRALALGDDLATWYEEGRKVAEKGLHLLTKASTEDRQGSPGKDYQASERNHSQRVNEINATGERVRQSLIQEYGLDFPPLN